MEKLFLDKWRTRNSSFELMRLVAMLMIVIGHCMSATAQNSQPYLGLVDCIGWGCKSFSVCAVNLFFLLTGYYVTSIKFKISRVAELWLKTIFYSVCIYVLLSCVCGIFSLHDLFSYFFPVFTKKYWFIQTYIVIALIVPFFSLICESISSSSLKYLLTVLFIFFCFHESFFKVKYTLDQTQGYGIIWGCFMVLVGHFLYRFSSYVSKFCCRTYFCVYLIISVAIFISNYLIVFYNIAGGLESRSKFYSYNSITVFFQSVFLFCFFIKLSYPIKSYSFVNYLGKNSLSVYLISGHPILMFSFWKYIFSSNYIQEKPLLFLAGAFVISIVLLFFCIFIDKLVDYGLKKIHLNSLLLKMDRLYEVYIK